LQRTGSTNDDARARALGGDPGRLWIVAKEQVAGRGRMGRVWSSPPGNLYASALLIDPAPAARLAEIGFVAGVALREAAHDIAADLGANAETADLRLKWPNDLVFRGAKLAGLLAESMRLDNGGMACVVGFGVNCRHAPEGLSYPTGDLSAILGADAPPERLLSRLVRRFDEALRQWDAGAGFAAIRARWLAGAAGLGGPIRVGRPQGPLTGAFEGIDRNGRLVVRTPDGAATIEAGDVFLLDYPSGATPEERKAAD
jgi:BirA family biotin operon repressor/biotin-[acetyl-CoA-carboxylase] ligase